MTAQDSAPSSQGAAKWAQPEALDAVDVAFPSGTLRLLPLMSEIPQEFKNETSRWCRVVSDWFFLGLKNAVWTPKAGVDTQQALRHIQACIGSYEPSHEHKEAGCAYLLSLWFDDVKYERAK